MSDADQINHAPLTLMMGASVDTVLLGRVRVADERRGLRPASVERKQLHLRVFMGWLEKPILDATTEDVERFLDGRKIVAKTRRCWLGHFRVFYDWAIAEGLCEHNPARRIPNPRLRRSLPRPATPDDLTRALAGATAMQRAWVLLAAFEGLRCAEIAGLRREDVRVHDWTLRVTGKGDHERLLPLHPEVLNALQNLPMPRKGYLFTTEGHAYKPKYLSKRFNEHLFARRIPVTAHQFRHFFGTEMYRQTQDLRLVQELMGHQNPNTTAVYVKIDPGRGRDAVWGLGGDAA